MLPCFCHKGLMDARGKAAETGKMRAPHDHETQLIATEQLHRLEIARYRAEAVAARIGVDCDRMLRMVPPSRRQWREAIGDALLACRNIVSQAQASVGIGEDEAAGPLAELQEVTRASMQRVADAMTVLLRTVPVTTQDELLIGDARAIHNLAIATQSTAALDVAPSAAGESPISTPAQAGGPATALAPRSTVLVVDDDEAIRKSLKQLLGRIGFAVLEAENGKVGLEMALTNPVDLVITDMDMPVMGGMDLLRELKASPGLSYLPVIVVSGQGDAEKVIKTIEMGAEDYVSKPFDATLLKARVRASLARKRLRDLDLDHMKRVSKLAAAVDAVERDQYTLGSLQDLSGGHDQIARLARAFERMAQTVRSREERLAQRLRLLRHEVGNLADSGPVSTTVSSDSPFSAGEVIAQRYQIVGQIGRGGMGMVYHATDAELKVDVAIKVVRADLVRQDPSLVDRLKSEIRLARELSHPNIVRAHDLGEWHGTHYLTMEFVRGVSLSALLDRRGRITVDAVVAIGIQLSDALAIAHEKKIIHRDIKPANVLMDENGALKVMDFGLAKSLVGEGLTQTGFVIGTPQYMSPEQLMGGDVDTRSDLFSVGVLLYECLCGRTPFDADSPVVVMTQMVDGTYPPLKNAVPDIPPSLEAIIARLLQLEANRRVQTATELSRLLAAIELVPATA